MSSVELVIPPREKDLGGFKVQRLLPYAKHRMVGPFIFLDHMGPAEFSANEGIDVRPHPHIGLATVTYLFEGELFHRDSLGSAQAITRGAVNWMTAGFGIVHSERTVEPEKSRPHRTHGVQSWVALPREFEEMTPEFHHHTAESLPELITNGVRLKIISGRAYGLEAPVKTYSPLFYMEAFMGQGHTITLPKEYKERALYLISGKLKIGNTPIEALQMPVFTNQDPVIVEALEPSHLLLLGGDPLSEPRFIDWNFVSSSPERLEQAKLDWKEGRFSKVPGDDQDFISLT